MRITIVLITLLSLASCKKSLSPQEEAEIHKKIKEEQLGKDVDNAVRAIEDSMAVKLLDSIQTNDSILYKGIEDVMYDRLYDDIEYDVKNQ